MDKKDKIEMGKENQDHWTDDWVLIKSEMVQFFFMGWFNAITDSWAWQ